MNEYADVLTDIITISTFRKEPKKRKTKPDDQSVKKYLVQQLKKVCLYDESFLMLQSNKALRVMINQYNKKHYIPEKNILIG